MENRINERLKTAKRRKQVHSASEHTGAREQQRLNQMQTSGSWIDNLTEFQVEDLEQLLIEDGVISEIVRLIGQGKEANVYWVRDDQGRDKALKLFRMFTTSHQDAFSQHGDTGKLQVAEGLALKEYLNLSYAQDGGVRVPKLGEREEFIFTMDFLGDDQGPAPLLRNVDLRDFGVDPISALDDVLDQLELMFNEATMVHGDFSEHNLVWYKEKIWVIDFLQSHRWHPKYDTPGRIKKVDALKILERDLSSVLDNFKRKYRVGYYLDEVLETMVHEKVEDDEPMDLMSMYYDPNWVNSKGRKRR